MIYEKSVRRPPKFDEYTVASVRSYYIFTKNVSVFFFLILVLKGETVTEKRDPENSSSNLRSNFAIGTYLVRYMFLKWCRIRWVTCVFYNKLSLCNRPGI